MEVRRGRWGLSPVLARRALNEACFVVRISYLVACVVASVALLRLSRETRHAMDASRFTNDALDGTLI